MAITIPGSKVRSQDRYFPRCLCCNGTFHDRAPGLAVCIPCVDKQSAEWLGNKLHTNPTFRKWWLDSYADRLAAKEALKQAEEQAAKPLDLPKPSISKVARGLIFEALEVFGCPVGSLEIRRWIAQEKEIALSRSCINSVLLNLRNTGAIEFELSAPRKGGRYFLYSLKARSEEAA